MSELTPIKLEDGSVILIESVKDVSVPITQLEEFAQEEALVSKDGMGGLYKNSRTLKGQSGHIQSIRSMPSDK